VVDEFLGFVFTRNRPDGYLAVLHLDCEVAIRTLLDEFCNPQETLLKDI
jgi:hypothetical protein